MGNVDGVTGITTEDGAVTIASDTLEVAQNIDSGAARTTLEPYSAGREIDLGSETANKLSLTDAELDRVVASALQIGNSSAGALDVSAPISPAGVVTMALVNGGPIAGSGTITIDNLRITSAGAVDLNNDNNVTRLAAEVSGPANSFRFRDAGADGIIVGNVDDVTGITTDNGAVTLTSDALEVAQNINSGTARTTLEPYSSGREIDLGGETAGKLSLTDLELDRVASGILQIGNSSAGAIDLSAAVSPSGTPTLTLINNGALGGAGSINVNNLRISSVGPVNLNNDNDVTRVAAEISGSGNAFRFRERDLGNDGLIVGNVDGVTGISTEDGAVTLTSDALEVAQSVDSGTARTTLEPYSAGRQIDLGGETSGKLSLKDVELGRISADVLQVGNSTAGSIDVSGVVSPGGVPTLSLINNGSVDGGGSIMVNSLRISSSGAVSLMNDNNVSELAANIHGFGNTFDFADADELVVSTVDGVSGIETASGAVNVEADSLALNAIVNSGAARTTLAPRTAGRNIDLGTKTAGKFSLTDTELDGVSAGVLQIGKGTSGSIDVSRTVSPGGAPTLSLVNNSSVSGAGNLRVDNLRISSAGPVTLNGANNVTTVAASVSGPGGFTFRDPNGVTIGAVDGIVGLQTDSGDITVSGNNINVTRAVFSGGGNIGLAGGTIGVSGPIVSAGGEIALTGGSVNVANTVNSSGGDIALTANAAQISQAIDAGAGRITIQPRDSGHSINLGSEAGGVLSFTADELDQFSGGILQIGSATAGPIDITGSINLLDNTSTLTLQSQSSIIESGLGALTVEQLCVKTPGNVTVELVGANDVDILATGEAPLRFRDVDDLNRTTPVDDCPAGVPVGSDLLLFGGSVTVRVLSEQLAAVAFVDIPTPRAASRTLFADAEIDNSLVAELVGPESIWTSSLDIPFLNEEPLQYRIEEQSKWLGGHLAVSGSTTGPQSPR